MLSGATMPRLARSSIRHRERIAVEVGEREPQQGSEPIVFVRHRMTLNSQ